MAKRIRRPARGAPNREALVDQTDSGDLPSADAPANDDLGVPVNGAQLAKHLDLTHVRISQLANEGHIPRNRDGSFPLDACRTAYIRSLRRAASQRARVTSGGDALRDAKLLKMQMDLQVQQGLLVQMADVEALLAETFGKLRNELAGLGASITRDLQLRGTIEEKVNDAVDRARATIEASAEAGFNDSEGNVEDEEAAA